MKSRAPVLLLCALAGCAAPTARALQGGPPAPGGPVPVGARVLRAAFVVTEGVYNSELMAPYDVFHHTFFRDARDYLEPFVVAETRDPILTFEGLELRPHFDFITAPEADVLVIPSTLGSMDRDLENPALMAYVRQGVARAQWVITVCDGAFVLAATGALDGRVATTFPADRDALKARFPRVDVRYDERLVVDGKFITSVGGGLSYEPALYLVERLWGPERVAKNARGLVWPWRLEDVPHVIAPPR